MAESRYNPKAVSRCGAEGLMQLMPLTAKSLGVADSFNPTDNISGGVRYFRTLLDGFNGDIKLALAAGTFANTAASPPFPKPAYTSKKCSGITACSRKAPE